MHNKKAKTKLKAAYAALCDRLERDYRRETIGERLLAGLERESGIEQEASIVRIRIYLESTRREERNYANVR